MWSTEVIEVIIFRMDLTSQYSSLLFFLFLFITSLLSYLSNNAICSLPSGLHPTRVSPLPPSLVLPIDDTGSPCSDFTLSSRHPLKWLWALGPCWSDSTLAFGPLNANKDRL
ncbi:hypothetical protein PAMP_012026 [Pampus punctatissimus]